MRYLLTVLSSGRPEYLARTLDALAEHLTPQPAAVYVYDDGGDLRQDLPYDLSRMFAASEYAADPARLGMCAAHAKCWQAAADSEFEWALHWEDDMVLLRPLDVDYLTETMDANRHLAQMALVRTPWGAEVEHGGYIPQTPGWYCRVASGRDEWIEQRRNWTCAPSLIRRDLARAFPWPTEPGCETTIGPAIIEAFPDAQFGLWGHGECWCAHVGVNRAEGSHGY